MMHSAYSVRGARLNTLSVTSGCSEELEEQTDQIYAALMALGASTGAGWGDADFGVDFDFLHNSEHYT
jgi:hypothetical protein